jgi:hypothetical protein
MVFVLAWTAGDASNLSCQSLLILFTAACLVCFSFVSVKIINFMKIMNFTSVDFTKLYLGSSCCELNSF